ncbi:MAG: hypothetical protein FWG31_03440 [Oscillospiraceae bacterium]|nr:hypothetical protein [Oscillospiraceae bacterium]
MDRNKSRERLLILFVCVLVLGAGYVVLLSTGIVEFDSSGLGIDPIEADTVELRYEYGVSDNRATVEGTVFITNQSTVNRILSMYNTARIKSTVKRIDNERYALYFYKDNTLVERWQIDMNGVSAFRTRNGTYTIANGSFDFDYIAGLL